MPEELTLPCPACGGRAWAHYEPTTIRIYCPRCDILGPRKDTVEEARAAWNALPRALEWTEEPPKEVGKYWWRWDAGSKYWIYNVKLIPTVHGLITYDHSAYNAEHVEDIPGQWAGPIPEPREPK